MWERLVPKDVWERLVPPMNISTNSRLARIPKEPSMRFDFANVSSKKGRRDPCRRGSAPHVVAQAHVEGLRFGATQRSMKFAKLSAYEYKDDAH